MTKQDIIRKLTSRKFWAAIALFVSGVLTATGHEDSAQQIYGLIMQAAAVVAYIIGEGLADSKTVNEGDVVFPSYDEEDEDEE